MSVLTLDQTNFDKIISETNGYVMVDFWAEWCGPCRMLSPVVDEIAQARPDVTVGKVNVDENPDLASRYQIMAIPAVLVFKDGALVANSVGVKPRAALESLLQ